MSKRIEIAIGTRFGKWTVIDLDEPGGAQARYLCRCDCGTNRSVASASLRRNDSNQCTRCARRAVNSGQWATKHGKCFSKAYSSWSHMLDRCKNENHRWWHRYGGRGIVVCERWNSFDSFYADMGDPPPKHSIDRIDNDGNYEPSNCRWATAKQQLSNRGKFKRRNGWLKVAA